MTKRSRKQKRLLHWQVVLDTNVLVAGIGWRGVSRQVLELWKTGQIQLVLSAEIIDEYLDVLGRWVNRASLEYWRFWFSHPSKVTRVHSGTRRFKATRDVTDNKFVDVAIAGQVRYVITHDKDLLSLGKFRETCFVNPKTFLGLFRSQRRGDK